jgi:alpha/beta hydrolase family protein
MCATGGSYIPLARTAAERAASGDPRRSLEERYRSHEDYVRKFERAAKELVKDRFLIRADAQALVEQAKALELGLPKN